MSQSRVRSACRWHRGSCCEVLLLQNTKVQDVQLPPLPRLRKLNLAYCRVQNTMLRRAASASGTKGRTQAMVALQKERRARRVQPVQVRENGENGANVVPIHFGENSFL